MEDNQFVRIEAYSSARPKKKGRNGKNVGGNATKWSASDILDEADRVPTASHHINAPSPPVWLVGSRHAIEEAGARWVAETRYPCGRKVRSDAPWLGASVASMPRSRLADWPAYRDRTIAWYDARYPGCLRGAVEHLDEANPHLHIYLVPRPGDEFGSVHDGYAAKAKARRAKKADPSLSKVVPAQYAFKKAMIAFLDAFHEDVAKAFNLERVGPRRMRLTRESFKSKRNKERLTAELAEMEEAQRTAEHQLKMTRQAADKERKVLELQHADAQREAAEVLAAARAEAKCVAEKGLQQAQQSMAAALQKEAGAQLERAAATKEKQELLALQMKIHGAYKLLEEKDLWPRLVRMQAEIEAAQEALRLLDSTAAAAHISKVQQHVPELEFVSRQPLDSRKPRPA